MTTTNWIFANVCYFILFIVDFPAYVVDKWTCEDICVAYQIEVLFVCLSKKHFKSDMKNCHCRA